MKTRNAVWYLSAALSVLAGYKGIPTKDEKDARQKLQIVSHDYRPEDHKPPLPSLGANSSLGDFLKFAMLNQPSVEAAYYDWSASVERITTARSRPDPQLTFQMDIENIVSSVMPGFMVNFPGAGKLRAAASIASAESQARYFTFQSAVLETTYEVKRAYYQLHYLEDRIRVNRATLELLSELEKLARAQNEVGKVTLQDVLRAQIEQNRLKNDLANLEDTRNSLLADLKSALGIAPDQADPPEPKTFEPAALDLSSEKLLASAMEHSPRLKAMEAEVRAAEAAIVLANKDRNPDFAIGLMADARTSPVLYRPFATVSLPVWRDKIAAQIAQGQAAKKQHKRGSRANRLLSPWNLPRSRWPTAKQLAISKCCNRNSCPNSGSRSRSRVPVIWPVRSISLISQMPNKLYCDSRSPRSMRVNSANWRLLNYHSWHWVFDLEIRRLVWPGRPWNVRRR